jgi:cell division protein FtsI (penicillin-binding protein 3)
MSAVEAPTILQRRIVIAAALCVAAFALVGVRLIDVTLLKGGGDAAHKPARALLSRADIVDRNGQLLARDLPVHDVYVHPAAFSDRAQAAHALAQVIGASEPRLLHMFESKHPYVLVARQISPDVQDRVMSLGLPGIEFPRSQKRFYPEGSAAAQVIGVTDSDGHGLSGIERGLDAELRANTHPVQLSLDMRVQYALAHELALSKTEFSAKAAGGIVIDVRTGEIIAMASLPDFDPNARNFDKESGRNRMAQDTYELGSVFKIFTFAMANEDHTTRMDELFPVGSGFKLGRYTIHDAEHMPAFMAARDILAQSSNAGTAQIALRSGADRQRAFLANLGLLMPIHAEVSESRTPSIPLHWGDIETATIGFGHGIAVTPLAFVTAASIVVNGGRKITPTFLKHPEDSRGEQLIKPATSAAMRDLLRYVVTDGTGRNANVEGYNVGGKTGSAQEVGSNGRYIEHQLLTSFCGVFPIDNPRYLVFVMLDEPHGTKATFGLALAGHTAAPLAGAVIARIAPILGMPRAVADAGNSP